MNLNEKLYQAVWIAHSLFERGKTSGTTANISFLDDGVVWISRSGSCFGMLQAEDFVPVSLSGGHTGSGNNKPSKELPLHLALYSSCDERRLSFMPMHPTARSGHVSRTATAVTCCRAIRRT